MNLNDVTYVRQTAAGPHSAPIRTVTHTHTTTRSIPAVTFAKAVGTAIHVCIWNNPGVEVVAEKIVKALVPQPGAKH